jgi:hypothetical protein
VNARAHALVYIALLAVLVPWTVLTLPGLPMAKLAQEVWYVTFISHIALVLALVGSLQGAFAEKKAEDA